MRPRLGMIPTKMLTAGLIFGLMTAACNSQPQTPHQAPIREVTTVTVQPQPVVLSSELPGRTSAYRIAEIRPQVNGIIQKRLFTQGAEVRAGQVLYQIDPAPFKAALGSANAALIRAQANLPALRSQVERFKEAFTEKAVSQQDLDNAVAALNQAEADAQYWKATIETARINLGYCSVNAPISGRIGRSSVTEGAIVTAYQPLALATIQQLDPIYVDVPQSTTELLRLQKRLKEGSLAREGEGINNVSLILKDGAPYPHEGKLRVREVTVDPTTGSVTLRAEFPNPEGVLLPGMFVRAVIKEGTANQAILVPQQGVSRDHRGNPYALVVGAGDKVEMKMLALDRAIGDSWLIDSGLDPGDRLIVEGLQMLRPGTVVKAVSSEQAPGTSTGQDGQPQASKDGGA